MAFIVILAPEAQNAIDAVPPKAQAKIAARIEWLQLGQGWRPPYVKSIQNTDLEGLLELRIDFGRIPYRFLFAVESEERLVILCGGSKKGIDRFYKIMIPLAEKIFHNRNIQSEDQQE